MSESDPTFGFFSEVLVPPIEWNGPGFWLGAGCLAVSLACLIIGAVALVFPDRKSGRMRGYARAALTVSALAFFVADSAAWAGAKTGPVERFFLLAALVVLGFCCHDLFRRLAFRVPWLASLVMMSGGLLLICWLSVRQQVEAFPVDRGAEVRAVMDEIRESVTMSPSETPAWTDKGYPVPLFRVGSKTAGLTSTLARAEEVQRRLLPTEQIMMTGPIDVTHNCHGWVFTGGRFLIHSNEVDRILADNGYAQVDTPASGDLIIYRGDDRTPVHSGIVKAIGVNCVLIESKWGMIGSRLLHAPESQGFSSRFAYYRSPRKGHLLQGQESTDTAQK